MKILDRFFKCKCEHSEHLLRYMRAVREALISLHDKVDTLMVKVRDLGAEVTASKEDIVALLNTIDAKVESLFEQANNPDVPEEVANQIRADLAEIKDAAAKVGTDDPADTEEQPSGSSDDSGETPA